MTENNIKYCNICNVRSLGEYCHICGQKNTGKKLNILTVTQDFLSNLFSLEKSGVATMIYIIKAPLKVIKSYWDGYRRYFEPPSKLILYASIIIGIHIIYHDNLIFGVQFTDEPQGFFIVLFLALLTFSSYITYFKRKYSFLEHLIANIYLFCTWVIVMIILYEIIFYFIGESLGLSCSFSFLLIGFILIYSSKVMSIKAGWISTVTSVFMQLIILILILTILITIVVVFGSLEISFE